MQSRRHQMPQRQRRDSARGWIRSAGVKVTLKAYAKRYGVDRYTAYDDLTALRFALPASAQHWAQRPPSTPRHPREDNGSRFDDENWIMLESRLYIVAGYTAGGAPFGVFADEIEPFDDPGDDQLGWWQPSPPK
jgi:hypothetical protein